MNLLQVLGLIVLFMAIVLFLAHRLGMFLVDVDRLHDEFSDKWEKNQEQTRTKKEEGV